MSKRNNPFGRPEPVEVNVDAEQIRAAGRKIVGFMAAGIVGLAALSGILSSFYIVQPEERGIVKRFGRIVRTADPGLHFKIPFGIETHQLVATERILKEEFGFRTTSMEEARTTYDTSGLDDETLMLTGDLNVIEVTWVVQYRITDPEKFLYRGLREPITALRDCSEAIMRRIVGNRLGSDVLTVGRTEIAIRAAQELQAKLDEYNTGVTIVGVQLQDVTPPDAVKPSFNEVNEARQERERMINEAERERNQVLPRTLGEARQAVAEAEGYAVERVNRSLGESSRFLSILEEYAKAPEVTRDRMYLEMIDTVLPRVAEVTIIDSGSTQSPLPVLNLNPPAEVPAAATAGARQ
jgi:membrane protease subunit HflK